MERASNRIPDAILLSDVHLREDQPICRTDDYWQSQWRKMDFISDLQKRYSCPVLCGGDLFDKSRPSLNLVRETILHLPNQFYTCYGQHDLVNHSLAMVDKCGINLLWTAGSLTILKGTHFGQEPTEESLAIMTNGKFSTRRKPLTESEYRKIKDISTIEYPSPDREPIPLTDLSNRYKRILVWHKLAYQTLPFPGATGGNAKELLKKYPQFDLLLVGDNHQTFVEEYQGRLLVNPGSMMRMTAAQVDHKPCVYLWHADTNTVTPVYLPIQEGVVSREHLVEKKERDMRDRKSVV
jgi:DNA repair exonuclease SbcCD nuclease subunit